MFDAKIANAFYNSGIDLTDKLYSEIELNLKKMGYEIKAIQPSGKIKTITVRGNSLARFLTA